MALPDNNRNNNRILFLDIAKIAVTFLVIYAHLYSTWSVERLYIYSFHMPLFFIISGMVHKYKGFIQIRKYVKTILIPALFFMTLYDIIMIIPFHLGYETKWSGIERGTSILQSLWNVLIDGRNEKITEIRGNNICWFLFALFWCKVFTDCIKKKKYLVVFLIICMVFILAWYLHDSIFYLVQGIIALPFYYIGFLYKENIRRFMTEKRPSLLFLIAMVFLALNIFLTDINGRVSILGHIFGNLNVPFNLIVFYMNAFIGSMCVLCIASIVKMKSSLPQHLANALISVVGLQYIYIDPYIHIIGIDQPFIISIFVSIIIFVLCYLGHTIIMHLCPQIFGKNYG